MAEGEKVVMVLCGDRAMQDALREIVDAAGCRMVAAASVAAAARRLEQQHCILVLVDPLFATEAAASLAARAPVVEIPVRTSSTGVRRLAKHNDGAARWMRQLVAEHCKRG